jgi:hypothetical protein
MEEMVEMEVKKHLEEEAKQRMRMGRQQTVVRVEMVEPDTYLVVIYLLAAAVPLARIQSHIVEIEV